MIYFILGDTMKTKQFKTLNEQVEILKDRGLIIKDEEYVKRILLKENYFFLSGYRHLFYRSKKDKMYVNGVTFEELYSLFVFDRNIRNVLFKRLLIVENNVKSIFSYQMSKKYGIKEKEYLKPKNFSQDPIKTKQVNDLLRKMKRQIKTNVKQHNATLYYANNYGYIPLWVLVKVLSFGIIGELYSILKPEDQLVIAELYDLDVETLINYLPILSNYRNICAHEDIVYDNRTQRQIKDNKYHRELNIPLMDDEYIYGKDDIYSVIIILKYMLEKDQFDDLIDNLKLNVDELGNNIKAIPVRKILDIMGFPENWYEIKNK